ncbi:DMT family transporter [Bermanella marisrubri]|uniref:Probable transmembrane protein n=1 Tax=Bermanella marisrubri TaxID=207949 RepID=Q1N569_9GAMM|nr:DMT family transporter [Bermanella marisrubri]EAT13209.1 probable transmembrane protein [Oceanobacter sp. RED65] [Bermanella marisrubri]QIZ83977.1 DMT family transporter [Bermanella marisrubri]
MSIDSKAKGYVFGLTAVLIWSGFVLASRQGGLSELNHFDVIALRYGTCALLLLPLWWFKYRFNVFQTKYIAIALVGGLAYALCTFQGFQLAPASHGALLLPGTMPLFIFILAVIVGQIRVEAIKLFGIVLISSGVALLFTQQLMMDGDNNSVLKGDVLFLLGALCWGVFSILIKHWNIPPWHAVISLALLTCLVYLPWYVMFSPKNIDVAGANSILLQMFYQGFLATIVQLYFYGRAVAVLGASGMGSLMALVPVIAGVSAIFVFDEPVTLYLIVGLCVVTIGAWLTQLEKIQWKRKFAS